MGSKKKEIAERVLSFLKNYPDEWISYEKSTKHERTGIRIGKRRIFGAFIQYQSYRVHYSGSIARKIRRAYNEWTIYLQQKIEQESLHHIGEAISSTDGLKAHQVATLKKNGDI